MTNRREAELLLEDNFRERIAEAHFQAILKVEKM
jgi:N-acetylmuramoyl-L-alanine amidase